MKNGVNVIECLEENDPGSEGRVLIEIFKLMGVKSALVRVNSIEQLLEALSENTFKHIHITTHGVVTHVNKFEGWWTPSGIGSRKNLEKHSLDLSCTSLVSNACRSGSKTFAHHVTDVWGCDYYIAPTGCPRFHNSVLFSHIYYHSLFKAKGSVSQAFSSYQETYKNPHKFSLFERVTR